MPCVLITGGGKRIGKGLAEAFAGKGWDVIIHYNKSAQGANETVEKIKVSGIRSTAVKADLQSSQEIRNAFDEAIAKVGIPDVLINNAGVFPPSIELKNLTEEVWDSTMGVNLKAHYLFSKVFAEKAKAGSRIINIASVGGLEVWKHRIPYNVSKAAAIHLTRALARELAPNISVNCICPGTIIFPEDGDTSKGAEKVPMGRFGVVNDIFEAAYFFATCTSFITGQILTVDGGFHDSR